MDKKNIYESIAAIMQELDAIGKTRKNQQQGYSFRGIDDVYNAIHPLLARHGVFIVPTVLDAQKQERQSNKGAALLYVCLKVEYTFYAPDGSFVKAVVYGEGMDSGDKASYKALSGCHKYALLQTFCIPTEEAKYAENDHHELVLPTITPEQADIIAFELHAREGGDIDKLKTAYNVKDLLEIPAFRYDEIMKIIQSKKLKGA